MDGLGFSEKAEDTAMRAKKASFGKTLSEVCHGFRKGFFDRNRQKLLA